MADMKRARWYDVTTPFSYTEAVLDFGIGPQYEGQHWLAVRATSAVRAKVLALRAWRRRWVRTYADRPDFMRDGGNPFAAIEARPMSLPEMERAA
jgi:hypothetical protein